MLITYQNHNPVALCTLRSVVCSIFTTVVSNPISPNESASCTWPQHETAPSTIPGKATTSFAANSLQTIEVLAQPRLRLLDRYRS